jgi:hypothetical protein
MQTIENIFSSGIQDTRTFFTDLKAPVTKDLHSLNKTIHRGERDVEREGRRLRKGAVKDLHHARRTIRHGVHSAETTFSHVKKDLHHDWNKLDTFAQKQYRHVKKAVSDGVGDVESGWNSLANWVDSGVDSMEKDFWLIAIVGGVLLYTFREPLGTGAKYIYNEARSTGKEFLDSAAKAAPYAPLLLL